MGRVSVRLHRTALAWMRTPKRSTHKNRMAPFLFDLMKACLEKYMVDPLVFVCVIEG